MNTETILQTKGNTVLVWRHGYACPLQMRKGCNTVFRCSPERITPWRDATPLTRQRAEQMWQRAGRTLDEATKQRIWLADGTDNIGGVMTLATQSVIDQIKSLIPEAIEANRRAQESAEKAEAERKAAYERRRADVIAACPADCEPCTMGKWFDGIQTYIAPDGTQFDQWDGADAHGCGIVYIKREIVADARRRAAERQAAEKTAAEKAAAENAARAAHRDDCFRRARETGERIEISHYTTDCNDPKEECSLDVVTIWAEPDGTTSETRHHTW